MAKDGLGFILIVILVIGAVYFISQQGYTAPKIPDGKGGAGIPGAKELSDSEAQEELDSLKGNLLIDDLTSASSSGSSSSSSSSGSSSSSSSTNTEVIIHDPDPVTEVNDPVIILNETDKDEKIEITKDGTLITIETQWNKLETAEKFLSVVAAGTAAAAGIVVVKAIANPSTYSVTATATKNFTKPYKVDGVLLSQTNTARVVKYGINDPYPAWALTESGVPQTANLVVSGPNVGGGTSYVITPNTPKFASTSTGITATTQIIPVVAKGGAEITQISLTAGGEIINFDDLRVTLKPGEISTIGKGGQINITTSSTTTANSVTTNKGLLKLNEMFGQNADDVIVKYGDDIIANYGDDVIKTTAGQHVTTAFRTYGDDVLKGIPIYGDDVIRTTTGAIQLTNTGTSAKQAVGITKTLTSLSDGGAAVNAVERIDRGASAAISKVIGKTPGVNKVAEKIGTKIAASTVASGVLEVASPVLLVYTVVDLSSKAVNKLYERNTGRDITSWVGDETTMTDASKGVFELVSTAMSILSSGGGMKMQMTGSTLEYFTYKMLNPEANEYVKIVSISPETYKLTLKKVDPQKKNQYFQMSIGGEEYAYDELLGGELFTSSKSTNTMSIKPFTKPIALNLMQLADGTYMINPMLPDEEYENQILLFYRLLAEEHGIPTVMMGNAVYYINYKQLAVSLGGIAIILSAGILIFKKDRRIKKKGRKQITLTKGKKRETFKYY